MIKLVIQIPCWNEGSTIAQTLRTLPRSLPGVDSIDVLVVDDGSNDDTVSRSVEIDGISVVRLARHLGLSSAFSAGVAEALNRGADILVNTDADLQYPSEYIAGLIAPLLDGSADMVVGDRLSQTPPPFGPVKMLLQRLGSRIIRWFTHVPVRDAASGFRAFNRDVMESMIIHNEFSYTLESLMLAGRKRFRLVNVPIRTNPSQRKSRLFKNVRQYLSRSAMVIVRSYLMYHPLRFFCSAGLLFTSGALVLGVRFVLFYLAGRGGGAYPVVNPYGGAGNAWLSVPGAGNAGRCGRRKPKTPGRCAAAPGTPQSRITTAALNPIAPPLSTAYLNPSVRYRAIVRCAFMERDCSRVYCRIAAWSLLCAVSDSRKRLRSATASSTTGSVVTRASQREAISTHGPAANPITGIPLAISAASVLDELREEKNAQAISMVFSAASSSASLSQPVTRK